MKQSSPQRLLGVLRASGPASPGALMSRLDLSQPTLFRAARSQPAKVVAMGAKRNRKIAALRDIPGLKLRTPVFTVSLEGDIEPVGDVLALYPNSFAFLAEEAPTRPRFYSGLPAFLNDVRPSGFLGNAFVKKNADLNLPARLTDWSNDQILQAIARRGEDLPGNVLVGAESFERLQGLRNEAPEIIDSENPEEKYLAHANSAICGELRGSLMGGEQPKFSVFVTNGKSSVKNVLVKFSPEGDTFPARRWRDLLQCEHIALEILRDQRINVADARILEAGGRVFLEIERFDRVGLHGRRRVLSLSALDGSRTAHKEPWTVAASQLEHEKKISSDDLKTIQKLECFGRLIANNDRGPDNLSFLWQRGDPQASLAPVYDMLPMLYAPNAKGTDEAKQFTMPTYDPSLMRAWSWACSAAEAYWERIIVNGKISAEFRKIAEHNRKLVVTKGS